MSFESRGTEKEPTMREEIEALELRVHRLVGEVGANLDQVKVDELGSTAEGQGKLLKIYEASKRFNEKIQACVAGLATASVGTMFISNLVSNPELQANFAKDAQLFSLATVTGVAVGIFLSLVAGINLEKRARDVLDKIKKQ